jgi:hypothetical protein
MSGDKMDVEAAEQKMNSMEHSEQHYFKRYVVVATQSDLLPLIHRCKDRMTDMAQLRKTVMTTTVRYYPDRPDGP